MTEKQVKVQAALSYSAPFLIEKLLKDRIAATKDEAEDLFLEVKRFLVLVRTDTDSIWDMYSRRVDEAWHQFVLFTREYIEYSLECFGSYVQHNPGNSPPRGEDESQRPSEASRCFHEFKDRYEEFYGVPLPEAWYDARSVTPQRRILNDTAGDQALRVVDDRIELLGEDRRILISVSALARDALDFISRTGAFYVRELPGELTDDEKVGLVTALVEQNVLRVAP